METEVKQEPKPVTESVSTATREFNFEQWANQVRPQLMASLQKRGK
jgi:hypothetical protein